jgi:hypothetical protein
MLPELTEDNFVAYAMKHYDNPSCHSVSEFASDLKRFLYLQKLFNRIEKTCKERLILNHIIVLHNLFGLQPCVKMLYFKIPKDQWKYLNTFLLYLHYIDYRENIELDETIIDILRKI